MFLLQLYPSHMAQNIPILLPLMKAAIEIKGPESVPERLQTANNDLKTAQVKTVSFLTFLLRASADYLRPHQQELATAIVELLKSCPDIVAVRKELLVAMRHVLTTDLRQGFFT
jgi:transformation/transcription domain-associated protein